MPFVVRRNEGEEKKEKRGEAREATVAERQLFQNMHLLKYRNPHLERFDEYYYANSGLKGGAALPIPPAPEITVAVSG